MILTAHRANTGVCPSTYPNSTEYATVQGKPRVLDWSMPMLPTPEDAAIDSTDLLHLMDQRLREIARDLPPEVKADFLEDLIQKCAALLPGFDASKLDATLDKLAEKAREAVREAKLAYLPRAKEQGKLPPELVARTVIYEAACQVWTMITGATTVRPAPGPS